MKTRLFYTLIILGSFYLSGTQDIKAQRRDIPPGRVDKPPLKNNNGPGNSSRPNAPTGVPIDGASGLLLAAGAAYGLKKLRDYSKRSN